MMPQMDGPALLSRVKETWPDLKVIFISGYAEDKFRDQLKTPLGQFYPHHWQ
jgi:two-component system cell cycle sensor histidine kinase/response regulator CckA